MNGVEKKRECGDGYPNGKHDGVGVDVDSMGRCHE